MKSTVPWLLLIIVFFGCSCAGDPEPEDPINQIQEENLEDANLAEEDDFEGNQGDFINSDVNNEFVDNEGQMNLGNNQNILSEEDAVNFEDGEFQNNAMLQNEGNNFLNQNGTLDQGDQLGLNQFNNQGQQLFNDQGQPFNNQGQQLFNNQGQLFNNQGQLFNNQGQLFNNQGQQLFDNQGGEGINNALDNDEFLQNDQNFQNAATDNSINDLVDQSAVGGGRVKYVLAGGSSLYNSPNGAVQAPLEKGDHPLVFDEGEWARTSDGYYIPNKDLTNAPVSRIKRKTGWIN